MYEKTTDKINVKVEPNYLTEQSSPDENHFVWSYHVTIKNEGHSTIQLTSRHWKITDAHGITQEIQGDGVIGEQPILNPGEIFEYTSGAPLRTPTGFMVGNYTMQGPEGMIFTVDIPAFSLDSPYQNKVLN